MGKTRLEDIIILNLIQSRSCSCPILWLRVENVLITLSLSLVLPSNQVASFEFKCHKDRGKEASLQPWSIIDMYEE